MFQSLEFPSHLLFFLFQLNEEENLENVVASPEGSTSGEDSSKSGEGGSGGSSSSSSSDAVKGNGVATLAQNKIFPAKQEPLLSEITGLPLDAQMQQNRLDVDERVEGSRQCSCSRPS
jgi:hypothetical protein